MTGKIFIYQFLSMLPGQAAMDSDFGLDVRKDALQTVIRVGDDPVLAFISLGTASQAIADHIYGPTEKAFGVH